MSLPNELVCIKYAQEKQKRINIYDFNFDVLESIIDWVCDITKISKEMFFSKSREREIVNTRAAYIKIAMKKTDYSSIKIGQKINKDHATVLYHNSFEHTDVMQIVNQII